MSVPRVFVFMIYSAHAYGQSWTEKQTQALQKISDYFTEIDTFSAGFSQISDDNSIEAGTMYFDRPDRALLNMTMAFSQLSSIINGLSFGIRRLILLIVFRSQVCLYPFYLRKMSALRVIT